MLPRLSLWLLVLTTGCALGSGKGRSTSAVAAWQSPQLDAGRRARFEAVSAELDQVLSSLQKTSRAPGIAVGIVLGGETVYAKSFGYRDVEQKKPFTADTPFPIASVTKSLTAMAILRLRDEGKVDLDAPAARYYPPLAKVSYVTRDAPPITLRHLMTHTSGLPEDNPWADVTENMTDADLAKLLDGAVMSRVPGVHFEYSNIGYGVLGRVIERVAGISNREYVRRVILEPLGMRQSGWGPEDFAPGTVAVGYRGREGAKEIDAPAVIAPAERLGVMDAAGGLYTTIGDLTRYVAFHLSAWPPRDDPETGPLRRSSVREMQQGVRSTKLEEFVPRLTARFAPAIAAQGPDGLALHRFSYGFGLTVHTTCETTWVEHSGGLPGYTTFLTMDPERGVGMVVFINDQRVRANVNEAVMTILRKAGLFVTPTVVAAPALLRARLEVHELLASWDDAKARALFEPTFFRYQTIDALRERFATLGRDHGTCRLDGEGVFANRLRGSWLEACDRGQIQFAAALGPGASPRLQALELRESMPPERGLERAAAAALDLLRTWDPTTAHTLLADATDAPRVERAFARLSAVHGPCKMDRPVDGDGKTHATFLLSCREQPLELTLALAPSGKVASVSGRAARSTTRPNCAD